ncbi:MAG TPA: GAF domain-containing protein [Thermoanaerobaculia bacterium]|nr:GAF domain-containing protein [Thermoanaerobaculia bacterium]
MSTPTLPPPPATETRPETYRRLQREIAAVLAGIDDPVTVMSTTACLLFQALPAASWVGFYRVVAPGLLRVGPYQGPLGCLEIPFDRGVCGAAARERASQLVPDVEAFPGHIACDAAARSEIVVPVDDAAGELVAVLDLDSHRPEAFDETDREGLEAIAALLARHLPAAARTGDHPHDASPPRRIRGSSQA